MPSAWGPSSQCGFDDLASLHVCQRSSENAHDVVYRPYNTNTLFSPGQVSVFLLHAVFETGDTNLGSSSGLGNDAREW